MLASTLVACSTSGYFIPPKATDTPSPDIAFLLQPPPTETPDPDPPQVETPAPTPTRFYFSSETPLPQATFTPPPINTTPILYYSQAADTLPVVAVRFGVRPEEITSPDPIPDGALLPPNQLLIIPRRLVNAASSQHIFPDSEVVYSPSAIDFDTNAFVKEAGGYLNTYKEWFKTTQTDTGAEIVERVAIENSINPRLLLALLEYQSGWVYGKPTDPQKIEYPMGQVDPKLGGLYRQLVWAVNQLSVGYYSWREGRLLELHFADGVSARLAPDLNAGSAALQYYFAQFYTGEQWVHAIDLQEGLPALYDRMFGSPWLRAQTVEPLYPPGLVQPPLILPFEVERVWSFTGGPHGAWEHDGSYAALDFAPASAASGCLESNAWVTASSSGLVVRSGNGVVVLDLDGDGHEQTGWVVLYLHVSTEKRAPVGTWVGAGDRLGHPSCEGGLATGTHVHVARKYNGEWIAADGPMPFVLSGWTAHAGDVAYKGTLVRGDMTITACTCTTLQTNIARSVDDPYEAGG
jgi:murein DD-endopeptidase MepM/ murein hydrolase activator NlpD